MARLIDRLRAAGVRVWLWDLTSDVGVPVFGCGLMHDPREAGWRAVGFYQGFGCHVDPGVAMLRATPSRSSVTRASAICASAVRMLVAV